MAVGRNRYSHVRSIRITCQAKQAKPSHAPGYQMGSLAIHIFSRVQRLPGAVVTKRG